MKTLTTILFMFLAMTIFAQKTNVREYPVIIKAANYTGSDYNHINWNDRYNVWHQITVKTCVTIQTTYKTGDEIIIATSTYDREMQLVITLDGDTICDKKIGKYKKEIFKYTIK